MLNTITYSLMTVVMIVIVLIPLYFIMKHEADKQKKNLEQQALKRNGIIKKGGLFFYQRLSVSLNGSEILIYSTPGGKNSPPHTHVMCSLNSLRDYKVKICREYKIFGIGTVFGQDIRINNPVFDEAFVIQGSDGMIVRELLAQEIQAKLLKLKDYNPILEINKNKFRLSIPRIPKDEEQYDHLIDTGLMLIKHAKEMG